MMGGMIMKCVGMSAGMECLVVVSLLAIVILAICFALKKHLLMLAIGVGIFILGCYVYWKQPMCPQPTSVPPALPSATNGVDDATCSSGEDCAKTNAVQCAEDGGGLLVRLMSASSKSLSAFYPSRGEYEDDDYGQSSWYWLFHVLVILYVSFILVALVGAEFLNRVRIGIRRYVGGFFGLHINVFWGYSDEAKTIAGGVDEGKGSVVFVMPEKRLWTSLSDDNDVHEIAKSGWKWILGRAGEITWLSSARRHFFMGGDGHRNVADAEALIRSYKGRSGITVYVRIGATADDNVLYKWADKWNRDADKSVEVVIVREESLVSRRFLLDNPMLSCPRIGIDTTTATVSGDFKVLLIGFGAQGKMLLNDMICDSQYLTSDGIPVHFEAHVFDRNISAYGGYEELRREAVSRYNIKFDNREVGSAPFWRFVREEMVKRPYNRVVVCVRDDRENIGIANDLARMYRGMHMSSDGIVFARVRDTLIDAYIESTFGREASKRAFTPFGAMGDTYSFANIVTRKWEKGAVWLNGDWGMEANARHDDKKDTAAWKSASFFNKESSRASFFHQRNLLRLIGYHVDEANDDNTCFNDNDPKNHLDVLAEDEHMRWMAFHFVRGINVWSPTAEEIEEVANRTGREVKHNMIDELNAHADLVPYADLPKVDACFDPINERHGHKRGKATQEKDKGFVRSEAMRRSGLGIRKT